MSLNTQQDGTDAVDLDSGLEALQESPEFRGTVEPLDGHVCHEHLSHIYEDPAEQVATAVPFLRQGLERGERCMYVIGDLSKEDVVAAMRDAGVDVDAALASGQFSFHAVEETYLRHGDFDPDEMIEFYRDAVEEATEEYEALRISAETTWMRDSSATLDRFMEYEAKVNHLFDAEDVIAICHYDRTAFPPEVVRDVIRTHPHLIYDGTVCHNGYYTPPGEFSGPDDAAREVERMTRTLVERTEAKVALRENERDFRRLHQITASSELSYEEKVRRLLELGCERFDLDLGALNRVDADADRFRVEYVRGEHDDFEPGVELPLSETYCRAAVDVEDATTVTDPAEEGFGDVTVYEEFGVEGYLGTYVPVEGGADRTLAFVPDGSAVDAISEEDRTFLELMGHWIGCELERRQRERELEEHEAYTNDLLDAVDDLFYVLDADGSLRRWNESTTDVTGYDDAEKRSMNVLDFFEGDDREVIADGIAEALETGSVRVEADLVTKDGASIPYEFVASALADPDGNTVLTGIGRDVSERVSRERSQRRLYEITADKDLSFEEKVRRLLELGCERFDLDQGYLTRYHPDEGIVENEHASGPPDQDLRTGIPNAQPKPGQFCRATVDADEPMGVPDVGELGWDDDPVYRESGLRSYFGVGVTDGSEPYGTLAFCDTAVREQPFTDAERTFLELMGQWVSHVLEQRHRETQLAALNEMSRAMTRAETDEEIAEVAVEFAWQSLELPLTAIVTYDRGTGELSPVAQTSCADDQLPTEAPCDRDGGWLWEAFVAGETRLLEDVASLPGAGDDLTGTLAVPLGQQGLFVTATTAPGGFSDATREFAGTVAATVEAALTRADREQQLQERERTLEEQNETLARLDRVNDIIRNIDRALVEASTREEIERVVPEQLADVGPYELAWIGDHDPVTDEVTPVEWAGTEKGYLDEITVTSGDEPTGRGPIGRAVRTRETQAVDDVLEDDSFRPWRQEALNRGYHGCIALPLVYEEALYGVVVVYAGQPGVFGELERAVLDELSDTIAYAINAVESKKALVSDEVTELEFAVDDAGMAVVELARELDCTFRHENLVPRADGGIRAFFSTRGCPAEDVLGFADRLPTVDLALVSEYEEDGERACLFEVDLTDESLAATVLTHGGQLQTVAVDDGTATVTVEVAADADVREFVDVFAAEYPDSELVAQRSRERPRRSPTEHRVALTEELTPRQLEALQTAYFAGYFEQPRVRSGREVAGTLGVSQPTFNAHLRAAQRKVCRRLFEAERP